MAPPGIAGTRGHSGRRAMTILAELLAGLLAAALLLLAFINLSPAALASAIRIAGPLLVGIAGIAVVAVGRAGLGAALVAAALAWSGINLLARKRPGPAPPG